MSNISNCYQIIRAQKSIFYLDRARGSLFITVEMHCMHIHTSNTDANAHFLILSVFQ